MQYASEVKNVDANSKSQFLKTRVSKGTRMAAKLNVKQIMENISISRSYFPRLPSVGFSGTTPQGATGGMKLSSDILDVIMLLGLSALAQAIANCKQKCGKNIETYAHYGQHTKYCSNAALLYWKTVKLNPGNPKAYGCDDGWNRQRCSEIHEIYTMDVRIQRTRYEREIHENARHQSEPEEKPGNQLRFINRIHIHII